MPTIETRTEEKTLTLADLTRTPMGFAPKTTMMKETGSYARSLASAYLKYALPSSSVAQDDTVNSFVSMAAMHQGLLEDVRQFLRDEVDFVYEDQPVQPVLLQFSAWRLARASRTYTQTALKSSAMDSVDQAKAQVLACQQEYDALIQAI